MSTCSDYSSSEPESKHAEAEAQYAPPSFRSRSSYKPECPIVYFTRETRPDAIEASIFTLHCERLRVIVECYASTAMIRMEGQWTNRTEETLDCVFALPVSSGTVTNTTLRIGDTRIVTTTLLSIKDIEKRMKESQQQTTQRRNKQPIEGSGFGAGVFQLPFSGVASGGTISLICDYMQPLEYQTKKGYVVSLPLYFMPGTIGSPWNEVVEVECRIHSFFAPNSIVESWSHEVETNVDEQAGLIKVLCGACKPYIEPSAAQRRYPVTQTGRNFELAFSVNSETEDIRACCVQQTDFDDPNSGSMCILIAPPATMRTARPRAIFFLLDRSGSMAGEPYRAAQRGLNRALARLRPQDQFNICLFDHRGIYFQPSLVNASQQNISDAQEWLVSHSPEQGKTAMDKPLYAALYDLQQSDLLSFAMLITDGSVKNERKILKTISSETNLKTRFVTLGIGQFCNAYFLQMLAKIGRGFTDIAMEVDEITDKIEHLMSQISLPVLTDIEIETKTDDIELYPFPVPDLSKGAPVVIGVRYKSDVCPSVLTIHGTGHLGERQTITCSVEPRDDIPVHRMFVQKQMDLLTGEAWLTQSKPLEQTVTDLSLLHNVPCEYTDVAIYDMAESVLREEMKKVEKDKQSNDARRRQQQHVRYVGDPQRDNAWLWFYVVGGGSGNNDGLAPILDGLVYLHVEGLHTYGEVISGLVHSFGNLEATLMNVPILGLEAGDMALAGGCMCCGEELECCEMCECCEACECCAGLTVCDIPIGPCVIL